NTAGDSVLGEFDSVVHAVQCALRIQQNQARRNALCSPEERVDARIGVHLGDVIIEDEHIYGDGVNIAARLEPIADPGGICISEAVYQQIRNKLDLHIQDLGLRALKNIDHPVRLYMVPPLRLIDSPAVAPHEPGKADRDTNLDRRGQARLTIQGLSRPSFEVVWGADTHLGRAEGNDIVLDAPEVSRRHALVRRIAGDEYLLIDLGSANGTAVNGQPLSVPARLHNGDVIQIA